MELKFIEGVSQAFFSLGILNDESCVDKVVVLNSYGLTKTMSIELSPGHKILYRLLLLDQLRGTSPESSSNIILSNLYPSQSWKRSVWESFEWCMV